MYTTLKFCHNNKYDISRIISFEVNTKWLESVIDIPLSEFLDDYTSDESIPIYELALLKGELKK